MRSLIAGSFRAALAETYVHAASVFLVSVLIAAAGAKAQEPPHGDAVLDDAQLQERHARIGHISIEIDDVFEGEVHAGAYRAANAMHISTRAGTISEQLLFHSGDVYNRRVLDETERLLRGQRYLNAASIEPVAYNDDNTVDVIVRVHDVWTLSPGFSFGRKGGENSTRLELEDTNFLGLGKHISIARSSNVDRTAWRAAYADPNLFGSWWQLATAYADLSDGTASELSVTRPFNSLDARWSFRVAGADANTVESRYSLGEIADQFEQHKTSFEIGGGQSNGLIDGHALRYLYGYRYESREFAPAAVPSPYPMPTDRVLSYPWVGVEWLQDRYLETHNLEQIGRTEDIYLGTLAHFEFGASSTAFGSTHDGVIANGIFQSGAELGTDQYLIGSLAFNGRIEHGELNNAILDLSARYFLRHSEHRVLYASLTASKVENLDPEEQLQLGGDNGLRGYPLRYQSGTGRTLFTLEERFYTNWQPLKLVNVGAAVFFDAGRTFGTDPIAAPPVGWLKDIGAGLRLGSARSGLGNVIHIDVAFPLDAHKGGADINSMQLLIETRRSF